MVPPYDCDRVCDGLQLGGSRAAWGNSSKLPAAEILQSDMGSSSEPVQSMERNVVMQAGDRMVTAHCRTGEDIAQEQVGFFYLILFFCIFHVHHVQIIWDTAYTHNHILFTSCTR